MFGKGGDDTFIGSSGVHVMSGGRGQHSSLGRNGNDIVVVDPGSEDNLVTELSSEGIDLIDLTAIEMPLTVGVGSKTIPSFIDASNQYVLYLSAESNTQPTSRHNVLLLALIHSSTGRPLPRSPTGRWAEFAPAGGEVVEDPNAVAALEQACADMRPDEARAAGDEIEGHARGRMLPHRITGASGVAWRARPGGRGQPRRAQPRPAQPSRAQLVAIRNEPVDQT